MNLDDLGRPGLEYFISDGRLKEDSLNDLIDVL